METTATCIVGIVSGNSIVMGGDAAGTNGGTLRLTIREDKKVFTRKNGKDDWIFGFTTSFRMGQLVQYMLDLPVYDEKMDLHQFMVSKFIPALRSCYQAGGYEHKREERVSGGCFLVGFKGKLFIIYDDYQVAMPKDNFAAVGCGDALALGALVAMDKVKNNLSAEKKALIALETAEQYSAGVRGPFEIVSIKTTKAPN